MRVSLPCPVCGSKRFRRLYIRRQVFIKSNSSELEKLSEEARAIVMVLRRGEGYTKQRFVPIGWWCEFCGNVRIEEQPIHTGLCERIKKRRNISQ